jgi:hypothetical protein
MDTVCNLVIPIVDVPIVGMTTYSEYTYNRYTLYGYTHYRCPYNGCVLYRCIRSGSKVTLCLSAVVMTTSGVVARIVLGSV